MAEKTAEGEAPKAKRGRLRAVLMGVLVVVTSLSIVVAATTTWAHRTVFKTDRWLSVVGPLPKDPEVATAIARFTMDELASATDLRARLQAQLPPQLAPLVDPVLNALRSRVQARLVQFIESDAFNQVWVNLNRLAHDAIVKILRGESNRLLTGPNGEVRLNLVPLVYRALGVHPRERVLRPAGAHGSDGSRPGHRSPGGGCRRWPPSSDGPSTRRSRSRWCSRATA